MAAPTAETRFDEVGTLATDTELRAELDLLLTFIEQGNQVDCATSDLARALGRTANVYGHLTAPEGHIFVATVGARSRVSKPVKHHGDNLRLPVRPNSRGVVFGYRLTPIDVPVFGLPPTDSLLWRFGSVTLDVARLEPDCKELLQPTNFRIHLASTALTRIRVLQTERAVDYIEMVNPLSKSGRRKSSTNR